MIASRFRSVGMVACVTVAALGCYLVSQRVAAERAELAKVERQIASTRKALRQLGTEIVTRSRMPQLERWNAAVLGLTAPGANQFMDSEIRLASLDAPVPAPILPSTASAVQTVAYAAPVAATPVRTAEAAPAPAPAVERPLLRQATFVRPAPGTLGETPAAPVKVALVKVADVRPIAAKSVEVKVAKEPAPSTASSLLPADIGSLAAAERRQTTRK